MILNVKKNIKIVDVVHCVAFLSTVLFFSAQSNIQKFYFRKKLYQQKTFSSGLEQMSMYFGKSTGTGK